MSWSKRNRRIWAGGLLALLLVVGGSAAAIVAATDDETDDFVEEPDPTERDRARKEAEASVPLPTPIPETAKCPADQVTCEFGKSVATALLAPSLESAMALSEPTRLPCPNPPSPALSPLCDGGGEQTGYFTGVFGKRYGFVNPAGFREFVAQSSKAIGNSPRLMAIGCPANGPALDCSAFAAFTIGEARSEVVMVVLATRSGERFRIIGARSWSGLAPEARGGSQTFEQDTLPYKGPMMFIPVDLK